MMRDFSWQVFAKTGYVDSYLLYRELSEIEENEEFEGEEEQGEELTEL